MMTEDDIRARIVELEGQGSPSAMVRVQELKAVLGEWEVETDENDTLVDIMFQNLSNTQPDLWDQLPEFVQRKHNLYTFSQSKEAAKTKSGPKTWEDLLGEAIDEEKAEQEARIGKSFKWKDLLGESGAKLLAEKMKKIGKKGTGDKYLSEGFYTKIPDVASDIETAELIASLTKNGTHRPLLDIDFPAVVIPSSTEGHCHLYIDKELSWKDYRKLLNLLADLGIIEHGYRGASLARGYSALRLPWIKKEKVEETITHRF